jgi:UDPglucose 6-dehydrogenase
MNDFYSKAKIGIIGVGFVGDAIRYNVANITLYLRDPAKDMNATYDELKTCDGIFVCVPSPQNQDGSCDSSILEKVLEDLAGYTGVIISKVTATPDVYAELGAKYPNLVYVPEFLTAANASNDYAVENWAIIGGNIAAYKYEAERIIKYTKDQVTAIHCSITEASLVKYTINSFLATKVIFMNEIAELANSLNCSWPHMQRMIRMDHRMGPTHLQVPGPDGQYGFGGMCFPKDTSALLHYAKQLNVDLNILKSAVKKNTMLRLQLSK